MTLTTFARRRLCGIIGVAVLLGSTCVGRADTLRSFKPVRGFEAELHKPDRTATAFHEYSIKPFEIRPGKDTTTLVTRVARYNYVEFVMELTDKPKALDDGGTAVFADVLD